MSIYENPVLLYVIAAAVAVLVVLIISAGIIFFRKNNTDASYQELFDEFSDYDDSGKVQSEKKSSIVNRWNKMWGELFSDMGWRRYSSKTSNAGRDVFFGNVAFFILVTALTRNPAIALLLCVGLTYVGLVGLRTISQRAAAQISSQLPGFLFALKANIQADMTPDRAVLNVADSMPMPLREDLMILKNRLLSNSTFVEALEETAKHTSSRELKFLCACMIQASFTGANLEQQITTVQSVLDNRRKLTAEREKAVKSVMPSIYVSTFVLPGTFIAMYFLNSGVRDFWFHGIISWIALAVIIGLYVAGVWFSKMLVDNIRKL